jgi:hypothetical protein
MVSLCIDCMLNCFWEHGERHLDYELSFFKYDYGLLIQHKSVLKARRHQVGCLVYTNSIDNIVRQVEEKKRVFTKAAA